MGGGGKKTPQTKICNISEVWCPILMKFSQFIARWIWHTTALKYLSYPFGWPHKWRSHLEKNDLAGFANLVITKIWIYGSLYVFEGGESIFDITTELPCLDDLENPDRTWSCHMRTKIMAYFLVDSPTRNRSRSKALLLWLTVTQEGKSRWVSWGRRIF